MLTRQIRPNCDSSSSTYTSKVNTSLPLSNVGGLLNVSFHLHTHPTQAFYVTLNNSQDKFSCHTSPRMSGWLDGRKRLFRLPPDARYGCSRDSMTTSQVVNETHKHKHTHTHMQTQRLGRDCLYLSVLRVSSSALSLTLLNRRRFIHMNAFVY